MIDSLPRSLFNRLKLILHEQNAKLWKQQFLIIESANNEYYGMAYEYESFFMKTFNQITLSV